MRIHLILGLGLTLACTLGACRDDDDERNLFPNEAAGGGGEAGSAGTGGAAGSDAPPSDAGLTLSTEDGKLSGSMNADESVRSFLGIPYAKPPIGELRWKEPQKHESWTGVRDATQFGGRCAQLESTTLMNQASDDEDCLYLNVWTPAPAPAKKLPVMFWIHGGGNVNGSANEPVPYAGSGLFYSGEQLAKRGVVVISLNYRLGVFGFLAHSGLSEEGSKLGNQGLRDQQFALEWVKRNAASFGGDPQNVTIFGESAGSLDVCLHVASPLSRGLFKAAISESGGCTTYQTTAQSAQLAGDQLAAAVGCSGEDTLSCLRNKSVTDLLSAFSGNSSAPGFGPIIDGELLPQQPRVLYDRGEVAKVPYLLGSNSDEGTLFTLGLSSLDSEDAYRAAVQARFPDHLDEILQRYPVSDFMGAMNPYQAAIARVFGDSALVCSTWDAAQRFAATGAPTYLYNFDIPANVAGLGATHGSELVYVFGTSPSLSPEQSKVSELIQSYWTNLAKQGDPNGDKLLDWPKLDQNSDVRVNFSLEPSTVKDFRSELCEFWRTIYDERFAAESK